LTLLTMLGLIMHILLDLYRKSKTRKRKVKGFRGYE
jgi:hypothetical protein